MAINLDTKLPLLLRQVQELDDVPRKFPIQGLLRNIAEKILPYSVFVDKWPDYRVVVVKPKDDQIHKLPAYRLGIYSQDSRSLSSMLCQPGFLPNSVPIRIFGMPVDLIPAIEKAAQYHDMRLSVLKRNDHRIVTHALRKISHTEIESLRRSLPQDYYASSIDPEIHARTVALEWRYWKEFYESEEEAIEVTKYYMKSGLTVGIFTKANNKLVSWLLSNLDRSNMIGHTLPEYRKQNFLRYTLLELNYQRSLLKEPFYGYIVQSNQDGIDGMLRVGSTLYFAKKFVHAVLRPKHKSKI